MGKEEYPTSPLNKKILLEIAHAVKYNSFLKTRILFYVILIKKNMLLEIKSLRKDHTKSINLSKFFITAQGKLRTFSQ